MYVVKKDIVQMMCGGREARGYAIIPLNGFDKIDEKTGKVSQAKDFLIGIQAFQMEYKLGEDHHVKRIALNVKGSLYGDGKELRVDVSGILCDDSGNSVDEMFVHVVVIAMDGEDTDNEVLCAMQGFDMAFADDDHHLRYITVSKNTTFMQDDTNHRGDGKIYLEEKMVPKKAVEYLKQQQFCVLQGFHLEIKGADHHVQRIGINGENPKDMFIMADKHKDRAWIEKCYVESNLK